jgi:hypothetical protein
VRERARRRDRRPLHALYRRLLRLRREEPVLRPGAARVTVHGGDDRGSDRGKDHSWVALELDAPGAPSLLAVFNFGDAQVIDLPVDAAGWHCRLSTDARRWGGTGHEPDVAATPEGLRVLAPAWSALLYRRTA